MTPAMSPRQKQTNATIRAAAESDAESIAQLSCTLGYAATAEMTGGRLRAVLGSENDLVLVAMEDSGAVIGWLQAHASHVIESGFRVEIAGLIVSPEVRRCGVGRALVSRAEEWARKLGAEAMVVRNSDYVNASRLAGASNFRIIVFHVMPMFMSSVIVRMTFDMAGIILTAAGLVFIGLGAQPPLP